MVQLLKSVMSRIGENGFARKSRAPHFGNRDADYNGSLVTARGINFLPPRGRQGEKVKFF